MLASVQGKAPIHGGILSLPKSARMDQIERVIAEHQLINRRGLSMRQIARRLGMSASGHLMSILWDMTDASRLIAQPRKYQEFTAWDFMVPSDKLGLASDQVYGVEQSAPAAKR